MTATADGIGVLGSAAFTAARDAARGRLLAARDGDHWTGRLSSSALSTATAVAALRMVDRQTRDGGHADRMSRGATWLGDRQLADGSWGDTPASPGNLPTTILCWSVLAARDEDAARAGGGRPHEAAVARAAAWITRAAGGTDPATLVAALERLYGADRTFSVPILVHAAVCGRLGDPAARSTWSLVPQLPFELAALPRSWFHLVDMQVVSYALPALVAIGQVRHARAPGAFPLRQLRDLAVAPTLRTLTDIQPPGGGFLEATPLTSFVTMSLAAMGRADHPVAVQGVRFLVAAQRADGSWPIDTNLATWCTTLAVGALDAGDRGLAATLGPGERGAIRDWLLGQQWTRIHPATRAAPGGWAWTDLDGGVPDADDTSGAVLALACLSRADGGSPAAAVREAAQGGIRWLTNLANRDGGIPTFCRGWGRLPFDTSCPDITAHFLAAAAAWREVPGVADGPGTTRAIDAASRYLDAARRADGAWWPLWFGNQEHPDQANPVYGTARVVRARRDPRGAAWLLAAQAADGGVPCGPGLPATIEETAVAVEALAVMAESAADAALRDQAREGVARGVAWLLERTDGGREFPAAPIGLYFARLWYDEELYPLVFTVAALERAARCSVSRA